ncbi:17535_t:CDS:2 [Acaulospora morrowiae]|uniref:Transcription initiation factor TFIID subunit 8 n=1 Tax=Acaulospora morrowiae TaxID=94023 RepID=A0A9N9F804_9GLOM|nr:17535_t:CDS:2 [Acaulospora morrowiae]
MNVSKVQKPEANESNRPPVILGSGVANEICKKVGAFLAREAGFTSVTPSAYETLGNLTELFLSNLVQASQSYAELARRAQPNLNDIEKSLKDRNLRTGVLEGFMEKIRGKENYHDVASKLSSSLRPTPSTIKPESLIFVPEDIVESEGEFDETKNKRQKKSLSYTARPSYVPSYLPPFPSKHSYKKTPVYQKRHDSDPIQLRELSLVQVKLVEKSLQKLTRHNDDRILTHSNIPDSPSTSATVVSANSSPTANDSSMPPSILNFNSTILHTGANQKLKRDVKIDNLTPSEDLVQSEDKKKRRKIQVSWAELCTGK